MTDTTTDLKREADNLAVGHGSWRDNGTRLIWCGRNADGTYTFRNTTQALSRGPRISEKEAERFLAEEGPWHGPVKFEGIISDASVVLP